MPQRTFNYKNDDITVVWKPETCIHSTLCWKGLISVFNPKERPWIKMDGATTERIIEQVRQCPSGALSYHYNDERDTGDAEAIQSEEAKILKVEVLPNGPYVIRTECVIKHANGDEEKKNGKVSLCRCGKSGTKPYCDGTHNKIGNWE